MTKKIEKRSLEDTLTNEFVGATMFIRVQEFFTNHWKTVALTLTSLLLAAGILFPYFSTARLNQGDFVKADRLYHQLLGASKEETPELLQKLSLLLKGAPSLQEKYLPLLAQSLLNKGLLVEAADEIAKAPPLLQKNDLSLYLAFSEASLTADPDKAILLFESLEKNPQLLDTPLRTNALLQLQALYQAKGQEEKELTMLNELQNLHSPASDRFFSQALIGDITLREYLTDRLNHLKK